MKTTLLFRQGISLLALFLMVQSAGAGIFTLTVTAQGSGTVTRNPSNSSYPSNVVVAVTATPNAGWYFSNWSGDTNGSVNPLDITLDSSLNITGNFLPFPVYNLTLTTNGQGTIDLSPSGGSYYSNTVVTATATPAAGWVFAGWSGATNDSSNPVSLTLNGNNALTGTFAQLPAFDVQPVSITNGVGANASFTSHAAGTTPLNYQWYFNNSPLIGATSGTLGLTSVTPTQAGSYQVIVTNNYGSATSSVVALVLTNISGSTNVVYAANQASLVAALQAGGWVGLGFNGTLTLTNTINISNSVILDASGVNVTLSGGGAERLFTVAPGVTFAATNLTFANGACVVTNGTPGTAADAGAIYNNGGTVTLISCTLTNNTAQSLIAGGLARGGAIFNNGGTVSLCQSTLISNTAVGGGPYNSVSRNDFGTALGGAIYNTNGNMTVAACTVAANSCQSVIVLTDYSNGSGLTMGGALFHASGSLAVTGSIFSGNFALGSAGAGDQAQPASPAYGGALAATAGNLTIDHSQFLTNTANGGNAGREGAAGPALGGAIYSAAYLTVNDSSLVGNQALAGNNTEVPQGGMQGVDGSGGVIYNAATAVLNRCSVYSNYAQGGSAILSLYGQTHGGNGSGGGIFNAIRCAATNCTIVFNSAVGGGGEGDSVTQGTNGDVYGGGVFNNSGATFTAMNLTIADNIGDSFAQIYGTVTHGLVAGTQIANSNGTFRVHNCLIAYGGTNGNAYGPITDDGYNISSDGSANLSNNSYNFTDPQLGPLADNGGPTPTMAPLATSPAIDDGDPGTLLNSDQRGFLRPFGDGYDMGAVEYGSIYPAPSPANLSFTRSAPNLLLKFSATPTIVYHLQSSTNLTSWIDVETIGGFSSPSNISRTISPQGGARLFYRVWY